MLLGRVAMEDEAVFGSPVESAITALDQCRGRFAKLDQPPIEGEHRVWIVRLARDVDGFEVAAWQPGVGAGGESAGWSVGGPLHRRAATVASDRIEFAVGGDWRIAHPDFLAVVDERRAAQREEHHRCDARPRLTVTVARVA